MKNGDSTLKLIGKIFTITWYVDEGDANLHI